jgi:hypothetical protein
MTPKSLPNRSKWAQNAASLAQKMPKTSKITYPGPQCRPQSLLFPRASRAPAPKNRPCSQTPTKKQQKNRNDPQIASKSLKMTSECLKIESKKCQKSQKSPTQGLNVAPNTAFSPGRPAHQRQKTGLAPKHRQKNSKKKSK